MLKQICQTEEDKPCIWYHLYEESKKYNKQLNKTTDSDTDIENKLVVTNKEGLKGECGEWEIQILGCKIG